MRWNNLFDDLESQLEHELTAEEVDLQAEEERLRLGRLSLRDRIVSIHDAHKTGTESALRVTLSNGERIVVRSAAFGRDWFSADLVEDSARRSQCIVPLDAVAGLVLTTEQVEASLDARSGDDTSKALSARLSLPFVLRDLCRRRRALEVRTTTERIFGTIDRVGRDHFDLALHEPGQPRRQSAVTQLRIVAMSHLVLVRL